MLKIGWSTRDISTEKPVVMNGQFHIRVSEGVLDPVTVTALTIDDGNDFVVFVESDTVGIPDGVLKDVRNEVLKRRPEIDPLKIVINASHTHAGPYVGADDDNVDGWWKLSELPHDGVEITPPSEYYKFYIASICDAICESFEKRHEGSISYGYGFATVAHSRRAVYTKDLSKCGGQVNSRIVDGHASMYGNTNDESFSHYEAGTESFANFMFTFDENEKLTGAIINVPCPSQNSAQEYSLSADYWHEVRCEIKKHFGDIFILPQCAAAGDLSPRQLHYKKAETRRYRLKFPDYSPEKPLVRPFEMYRRLDIAERIADAFREVYSWASKEKYTDVSLVHSVKTIDLDRRIITDEEYEYCVTEKAKCMHAEPFVSTGDKKADLKQNSIIISSRHRYDTVLQKYEDQKKSATLSMELHVIKLGEIAFATNPFELFLDYQHRIQARSPFEQTFIVQLCGQPSGRSSYLATERGVWGVGYSASMYDNTVSPAGGQQLVDETVEELKRIY